MKRVDLHPVREGRVNGVVFEREKIIAGIVLGRGLNLLTRGRLIDVYAAGAVLGILAHHGRGPLRNEVLIDDHLGRRLLRRNHSYVWFLLIPAIVAVTTDENRISERNRDLTMRPVEAPTAKTADRRPQTGGKRRVRNRERIRPGWRMTGSWINDISKSAKRAVRVRPNE